MGINPKLISTDLTDEQYIYKGVTLQRLNKDYLWYAVFENEIINSSQYRHDLESWIDSAWVNENPQDACLPYPEINRVEVIDHTGRAYTNWNDDNKVEVSFQDKNRTMKIFIGRPEKKL